MSRPPIHPTSLTRYRKPLGPTGCEVVRAGGMGVSWDHSDSGSSRVAAWMRDAGNERDWWRVRCKRYARKHLSRQSVAGQLIAVYEEVDDR